MIYFYGRHSAACPADEQRAVFEDLGREWGLPYTIVMDGDVDGSIPFRDRPEGRKLWDALVPGDHIVVTTLERGWSNMEDLATVVRVMRRLGCRVRVIDMPVDTASEDGIAAVLAFGSLYEYNERLRGNRVRDAFQRRRGNGKPWSDTRPFGWRREGDDWVVLPEERKIADQMADLYKDGMGYLKIANLLAAAEISKPVYRRRKRKGRTPRRSYYTPTQVRRLLAARAAGYPKVPQVDLLGSVPSGKYV